MSILSLVILAAGLMTPLDRTIVSPAWLQEHLDDPNVVVVEIGSSSVDRPHIPGARFVPIESIVMREGWPPDQLPPVDKLRLAFENAGVGDDGRIILYSKNPLWATRAWFTLDYLGQGDRTSILDGGYDGWIAGKRPTISKRIPHTAKTFTPYPNATRLIGHDEVRAAVDAGALMIDARPAHEYHGFHRGRSVTRRGHIPGAECHPWQTNLTSDGSFRSMEHLRGVYANLVADPGARVIVYCRTGMEATMPYFVLRSLGYDVVLYDGSYTEWSRDPETTVVKTSAKR